MSNHAQKRRVMKVIYWKECKATQLWEKSGDSRWRETTTTGACGLMQDGTAVRKESWAWIPAPPLIKWLKLSKLHNLSKPQFAELQNENNP